MKELLLQDLKSITEASSAPMVSVYLSRDPHSDERPINERWKIALQKAEGYLLKDYTRSFVHTLLEPLRHMTLFQQLESPDKGLIIFHSREVQRFLRVQTNINDLVVVADSFHIKPLLRIRNTERGYLLINLTSKLITVYVETNSHLYRLDVLRNSAIFDSASASNSKNAVKEFFSRAVPSLYKTLTQYKFPVILAGTKEYVQQMRKLLHYPYLIDDFIVGSIEMMKTNELRECCFKILEPYYHKKELEAVYDLNLAVKKNQAITYIEDIALSAVLGKIVKLFVIENKQLWGKINHQTGEIFISPKQFDSHDDDVLDDICQIVLAKGGEVVVLRNIAHVTDHSAAAIVTDTSHLYDYNQHYSPGP